jgi:hypothetical protein
MAHVPFAKRICPVPTAALPCLNTTTVGLVTGHIHWLKNTKPVKLMQSVSIPVNSNSYFVASLYQ